RRGRQRHSRAAVCAHLAGPRHRVRHRGGGPRFGAQLHRGLEDGGVDCRGTPRRLAAMSAGEQDPPGTGASPDGLPPLREGIRAFDVRARKSLGQNFILDLNLTRRIARAAGSLKGTTVVEIGPGPGVLTRALFLEGAERIVAMERDERCRPGLEAIAQRYPGRLQVHYGDALTADWAALAAGS